MLARLKTFLAPPVFQNIEKTRKARMLNNVLIAGSLLVSLILIPGVSPLAAARADLLIMLVIYQVALLFVMRRGYIEATAASHVLGVWVIWTLMLWRGAGIKDSGFLA